MSEANTWHYYNRAAMPFPTPEFSPFTLMEPTPTPLPNAAPVRNQQQVIFYTAAERAVIAPFRKDYLNTTTPSQRKYIATRKILPALFSYWETLNPEDPRITDVKQSSTVSRRVRHTCTANFTATAEYIGLHTE